MIFWPWLLVAFAAGAVAMLLVASLIAGLAESVKPRCPAVLRSGQQCIGEPEHTGPHCAHIYGGAITQTYVWEDERAGVCPVGFFYK